MPKDKNFQVVAVLRRLNCAARDPQISLGFEMLSWNAVMLPFPRWGSTCSCNTRCVSKTIKGTRLQSIMISFKEERCHVFPFSHSSCSACDKGAWCCSSEERVSAIKVVLQEHGSCGTAPTAKVCTVQCLWAAASAAHLSGHTWCKCWLSCSPCPGTSVLTQAQLRLLPQIHCWPFC